MECETKEVRGCDVIIDITVMTYVIDSWSSRGGRRSSCVINSRSTWSQSVSLIKIGNNVVIYQ